MRHPVSINKEQFNRCLQENFVNFTGKQLYWRLFLIKLQALDLQLYQKYFLRNQQKNFRTSMSWRTPSVATSGTLNFVRFPGSHPCRSFFQFLTTASTLNQFQPKIKKKTNKKRTLHISDIKFSSRKQFPCLEILPFFVTEVNTTLFMDHKKRFLLML